MSEALTKHIVIAEPYCNCTHECLVNTIGIDSMPGILMTRTNIIVLFDLQRNLLSITHAWGANQSNPPQKRKNKSNNNRE